MAGDTYNGPTPLQLGNQNIQTNYYQGRPRQRASWPHQVGVMPSRADCFQDRAEAARLAQVLAGRGTAAFGEAAHVLTGGVLVGLGGVGKTQLAAAYARTAWSAGEVDLLLWLTANTRSAAVDVYAQAAVEVLGVDAEDREKAAKAFLAWLEPKAEAAPCRWLVVLDDVQNLNDLTGLWPPPSSQGRTLATTRRRDAALTGQGRRRIDVGEFTSAEAAGYITAALAAHDRTEPASDVAGLAADLGRLPLALSQAAAYLIDAGQSCAAYRTMLTDRAALTLAELTPDVLPDGQDHTMAAAWSLSVEYADQLRPVGLARPMLRLAAFLDPNGIPTSVLTSPPSVAYLAAHRANAPADDVPPLSPHDAAGAVRALHRLSLLNAPDPASARGRPSGLVRVHQIVQRVTRDDLTPAQYGQTARAAADALISIWPQPERDTVLAQALRACTTALAACAEAPLHRPDVHPVLSRTGNSLGESGQVSAAVDYFRHLAATTRHHLGPDHPDTLVTRTDLARWQGASGDAAGAAAATADLLDDIRGALGPDHPDTLATLSNLAHWRGEAGDVAGATSAAADLLSHVLRVLGPDHPHTLAARNNLAYRRGEAGDAAGAASTTAELLNHVMRILGPDHPHTLLTRSNLALWRGNSGDAAGAVTAYADLLTDQERVLGTEHPDTLTTRHNLAAWRGEAGDAAGAAAAYAEVLADRKRVLGPDHPDTLITRGNLAVWQEVLEERSGAADRASRGS
ncbi:FxSxx-COOH system tetratricopeptide repeat protein [Streptomyces asoensis]|uniref:FxSxx-COOH system tetratricopeptide repeat protein n=1 Tax=Streptomyces asoensis TaxID=249586 RepID=UPI0033D385A9